MEDILFDSINSSMIVEILGYFVFPLYVSISTRYRLRPTSLFFSLSPFQADTPMTSSTSWSHTRFFPISFSFVVFCRLKIVGPIAVMRYAFSFSYSYGRLTPKSSSPFDLLCTHIPIFKDDINSRSGRLIKCVVSACRGVEKTIYCWDNYCRHHTLH